MSRTGFPARAHETLADAQLRRNLGKATQTIRGKRAAVVDELPDWQALREAGRAIKERTLRHLLDTRAEVCTAADTSCLMHIGGALRRQRAGVRTMHVAEILAARE